MPRNNSLLALGLLAATFVMTECDGPETFTGHLGSTGGAGQTGLAGVGAAGTTGPAGMGVAGDGAAGMGLAGDMGMAGAGPAGVNGMAGMGPAGSGPAGNGTAGTGAAGTGSAGTGAAGTGTAGTTGKAGTGGAGTGAAGTGAAGTGGKAGTGGAAGTGAAGTGAAGAAGCNCMLKVEYQCKQDGPNVGTAVFAVRVTNTGTTPIALNTLTVRYWYTIDGTGAQSGTCNSAAHPCTVAFQPLNPAKTTANESAVISFGSGSLAPGANTGDVNVTMSGGNGTYNQTNDYSFASTGANYINRDQVTAYVSGKLMDGTAP
jgi:hypothetical protein